MPCYCIMDPGASHGKRRPPIPVEHCHPSRLRDECRARNLPYLGTKEERIEALKESGVEIIYPDDPVIPQPKIDASNHESHAKSDPTSLHLGSIPPSHCTNHAFTVSSPCTPGQPILSGDFKKRVVSIDRVLKLESSDDLQPNTPGETGELRRKGSDLYMYRTIGQRNGWYRISFDFLYI